MPVRMNQVMLVDQGLISAYGPGVETAANALLAGRRALRPAGLDAFPEPLAKLPVAVIPGPAATTPLPLLELLGKLFASANPMPADAALYVATTVGEIARLEAETLAGTVPCADSHIAQLPQRLAAILGLPGQTALVVSSACASSTSALALAASAIRCGQIDCALVVGCDLVSEFVLSGFAALMATDPEGAKPFDHDRKGMTLGSAVAFALLMSQTRASREQRPCLGVIAGWAMNNDANHLTGPSRDGKPLATAIQTALAMAGCTPETVVAVCAHGTGTMYNDRMEMLALQQIFTDRPRPTFSVKGGMGHTLGAAGVTESLLALEFLRRGQLPPTVGMTQPAPEAQEWVTQNAGPVSPTGVMLSTNSGFGGVNAALVLALAPLPATGNAQPPAMRTPQVAGQSAFPPPPACLAGPDEFAAPPNLGRFSPKVRLAFPAIAQALQAAGLTMDGKIGRPSDAPEHLRVGLVVFDDDGGADANHAYFADYVQAGRKLGRGQLFAYTLPTTVAAECAIALHLTGPLLYVASADGGRDGAWQAACGLLADGLAEAIVLLSATTTSAHAVVVLAELDGVRIGCAKRNPIVGRLSQPPECASFGQKTGRLCRTVVPPPGASAEPILHGQLEKPPHGKTKLFRTAPAEPPANREPNA